MCTHYQMLVTQGPALLHQLNPNTSAGLYCPEAADAVHDYLDSGQINPVRITGTSTFPMQIGGLQTVTLQQLMHLVPACQHRIVRGTRANGATHWFVVLNFQNQIYVADAMLHILTPDVANYVQTQGFTQLHRVTGGYDVTPVDPMDMSGDIF